jgi:hypothetical protein
LLLLWRSFFLWVVVNEASILFFRVDEGTSPSSKASEAKRLAFSSSVPCLPGTSFTILKSVLFVCLFVFLID